MSWIHQDAAAQLEGLPPAPKSVLVHLAQPACESCGIAWPGVPWLERKTGLGRTAVKAGLEWLVKAGHLRIHAYPQGGRGMSTEYIVLPGVAELSTAPCGNCRQRMKRGRRAAGIDNDETAKGAATRPVSAIPVAGDPQKGSPGGHQSVSESNQSRAHARRPVENSPPARPIPSDSPDPTPWSQNAAEARRLADEFGAVDDPPSSRDATPDP